MANFLGTLAARAAEHWKRSAAIVTNLTTAAPFAEPAALSTG